MVGIIRKVHMAAAMEYGPIDRFAPDLGIKSQGKDGEAVTPPALRFTDSNDGEMHVYVMSEEGRVALIKQLTGGLVVPSGRQH